MIFENFIPKSYILPEKDLEPFNPWLSTLISGKAQIFYTVGSDKIKYAANLKTIVNNDLVPMKLDITADVAGDLTNADFALLTVKTEMGRFDFKGNFDLAFSRRFQAIVHFPMPNPQERYRLWKHHYIHISRHHQAAP